MFVGVKGAGLIDTTIPYYTTVFTLSMPDSGHIDDFGCGEFYGAYSALICCLTDNSINPSNKATEASMERPSLG